MLKSATNMEQLLNKIMILSFCLKIPIPFQKLFVVIFFWLVVEFCHVVPPCCKKENGVKVLAQSSDQEVYCLLAEMGVTWRLLQWASVRRFLMLSGCVCVCVFKLLFLPQVY